MPMHDWTLVPDGIYHAFHQRWIASINDRLNAGVLPDDLYALPEQAAGGFTPDVLTLHSDEPDDVADAGATAVLARPKTRFVSEAELYRRKKNRIAVRHVSGDRVVAVLEIVSPGNKAADYPLETFIRKACDFRDPFPPGPRDPNSVHPLIWREFSADPFRLPAETPLTLVAYEAGTPVRAYVEPTAVGGRLPDMPLFIGRGRHVMVPLEETYRTAFDVQPRRWRDVLAPPA
ncbi:MAG: DUF4058 family protein [Fimbriiglobus sp.]|jgi:hypothetical protein|nr:DUF4058 family protein [Fimbriiglobus sp.]